MNSIPNWMLVIAASVAGDVIPDVVRFVYERWNESLRHAVNKCWQCLTHNAYRRQQREAEIEELVEAADPFDSDD